MLRETLAITALQSGVLFLALWGIFRLAPAIPANAKAWLWRLAFLKPLVSLLPFAVVSLPFLPAEQPPVTQWEPIVMPETLSLSTASVAMDGPAVVPPSRPDYLLFAWAIGVCLVALWGLVGMIRAMRMAARAKPVFDEAVIEAFEELAVAAQVHHLPRLLRSDDIAGAILVGGRKPAVVIPNDVSLSDLRLMMAHELAHIARRDLFWFGLASAVQSLFFFNPMVWVAARCSRLDHESATDRHASHLAGVPIQTYADMLLRATVVARPSFAPGSLPVAESYRSIHRRLEAMRHFNSKPTFWRKTATAALALLTLTMLPAYQLCAAAWPTPPLTLQASPKAEPVRWAVGQPEPRPGIQKKAAQAKKAEVRYFVTENGKVYELRPVKQSTSKLPIIRLKGVPAGTVYEVVRKGNSYEVQIVDRARVVTLTGTPRIAVKPVTTISVAGVTTVDPVKVKTTTVKPINVKVADPVIAVKPTKANVEVKTDLTWGTVKADPATKPTVVWGNGTDPIATKATIATTGKVINLQEVKGTVATSNTVNIALSPVKTTGVTYISKDKDVVFTTTTGFQTTKNDAIVTYQRAGTAYKAVQEPKKAQDVVTFKWDGKAYQTVMPTYKIHDVAFQNQTKSITYRIVDGAYQNQTKPVTYRVVDGAYTGAVKKYAVEGTKDGYWLISRDGKPYVATPVGSKGVQYIYQKSVGAVKSSYQSPEYRIINGDLYKLVQRGITNKAVKPAQDKKTSADPITKPDHNDVLDPTKG